MLGATRNPKIFDGDIELQRMSKELGKEKHFEYTNVAIYFGEENVTKKDPYYNGEGPERSGCNFCGGCMTGCRHNAKNTLDKNYLFLAQKKGSVVLAENEVVGIVPMDINGSGGYEVSVKSSKSVFKKRKKYTTRGVIFSGGVLGTVKLLLKLKSTTLPKISDKLGEDIRTNNETLISVSTLDKNKNVSKGVAIGSILHTDESSHLEVVRYAEGSSFWKLLHLPYTEGRNSFVRVFKLIVNFLKSPISYFKIYWVNSWAKSTVVLLFMQTIDSTIKFKRNIFGHMVSTISFGKKPTPFIPESIKLTENYSRIMNGKATSFALETLAGIPSTAHILGGAVMGENSTKGVIDKKNRVFGYENMYVIDGAMISSNPGVNPALSITAIAERAMDLIPSVSESRCR